MSNLSLPLRSRFSRGPSATSSGQPLVPSSSSDVVLNSATAVTLSSDRAGSLASAPNHGHSVNENVVPLVEPLEPAPQMEKGK